jgi:Protein of unknown function (DUF2439)
MQPFYFRVFYTHQVNKKQKAFKDGVMVLDRKVDDDGQIDQKDLHESSAARYLKNLGKAVKEIKTVSLQAVLNPGSARLYDENGKEIKFRSKFSADFDSTAGTYRGMIDNLLVEFDGGDQVWDFEPSEFKSGKCFLGLQVTRCKHSYMEYALELINNPQALKAGTNETCK